MEHAGAATTDSIAAEISAEVAQAVAARATETTKIQQDKFAQGSPKSIVKSEGISVVPSSCPVPGAVPDALPEPAAEPSAASWPKNLLNEGSEVVASRAPAPESPLKPAQLDLEAGNGRSGSGGLKEPLLGDPCGKPSASAPEKVAKQSAGTRCLKQCISVLLMLTLMVGCAWLVAGATPRGRRMQKRIETSIAQAVKKVTRGSAAGEDSADQEDYSAYARDMAFLDAALQGSVERPVGSVTGSSAAAQAEVAKARATAEQAVAARVEAASAATEKAALRRTKRRVESFFGNFGIP